jgi:hypothetical protein
VLIDERGGRRIRIDGCEALLHLRQVLVPTEPDDAPGDAGDRVREHHRHASDLGDRRGLDPLTELRRVRQLGVGRIRSLSLSNVADQTIRPLSRDANIVQVAMSRPVISRAMPAASTAPRDQTLTPTSLPIR